MKLELTKVFQDRMNDLKACCTAFGKSIRGVIQNSWMLMDADPLAPGTSEDTRPSKSDHQAIRALFDREEAGEQYARAMEEARPRQQQALAKNQSDILAGLERDFRIRHRSRVRMLAHEATARMVTGAERGVIQSGILAQLQLQLERIPDTQSSSEAS